MKKTHDAAKPASPQAKQGEGPGKDARREALLGAALRRNLQRRKQAVKGVKPVIGEE